MQDAPGLSDEDARAPLNGPSDAGALSKAGPSVALSMSQSEELEMGKDLVITLDFQG